MQDSHTGAFRACGPVTLKRVNGKTAGTTGSPWTVARLWKTGIFE